MSKITSVLIANRGEIAIRIAKTLKRLGITVFAIQSDLDKGAYHTLFADQVLHLSGETLKDTYLNIEKIITLAKQHKIDAIHPGYGFLSEKAEFAKACEDNDVIFIGPNSKSITAMGSKAEAKKLMQKAKVPTVPGYQGDDQSLENLTAQAKKIGYPVLIKASLGGGGKGMRIVRSDQELEKAIASAQSEAQKSFGDSHVIIEKFVENPRHIEFQIFGDAHGKLVHLGERECSIQRRHQKIIEETPSPVMTDKLRAKMAEAALNCGKTLSYQNAGTVEFILSEKGEFYFLEVNTRLQVEHPITECRTGLDLVEWQVRIAQGEELPLKQDEITFRGHAIECRLYAEDAENQFLPSIGELVRYDEPTAPFLRIDSGVRQNSEISLNFDPMISKVITQGATREEAISRMIWTLENYIVLGVKTNAALLIDILKHDAFRKGETTTHFLDEYFPKWMDSPTPDILNLIAEILQTPARVAAKASTTVSSTQSANDIYPHLSNFRVSERK